MFLIIIECKSKGPSVPTTKNLEGLVKLFPDRGIRKKTKG